MPMQRFLLVVIIVLTFLGCNSISKQIQLVKDVESPYVIFIPHNADADEVRAANFLQYHLYRISGVEFPILQTDSLLPENYISISKSQEITKDDDFQVTFNDNSISIKGGAGKGCIYGVSEILERYLGVRYYSPDYIVIPKSKNISIPSANIVGTSPNTYRNINGDFTKNQDYKDFHRLHTIDDMFPEGYFVHTFHRLMPWAEYFAKHPEYYAYMNGKRIIDQLCLTNEDVYSIVVDRLREEMALQPNKMVWSVSQDDNFSYCQCENCSKIIEQEESPSGPIIHFVNRIADEFPHKIISTLAYQYSRQAPAITKPRSNVQIMLCTIELNRSKPITTDPTSVSLLKDLEEWGRISNHIFLWDYTVNFNHHISPFPNLHTLQPNIQLFVRNNVNEHFQQSNTSSGHEFSELKSYLIAKLLWHPEADVKTLIEEFTNGYYGPAAKWIREYIYSLESEIIRLGQRLDIYEPPTNHQHGLLSSDNIEKYLSFFRQAEKAIENQKPYNLHVRQAKMPLQYAIMEIGKSDMFGPRGWYSEVDRDFVPRQDMVDMLEEFYQTSIDCKAISVNESGLTPLDYYNSTKRFVDVQVKGNLAFRKTVTASPIPAEKYSKGNLAYLTNGVRGANDYNVHWIGWEAKDFKLTLDLEELVNATTIEISTLWDQKSWILHPLSVTCFVSSDGENYTKISTQTVEGDQRIENVNRIFAFAAPQKSFRFARFDVKGTLKLFDWHPSAGGGSWVFVDEIVVR
jgi:hypothetical protein